MKIVNILGGLGNQLFQYAFAIALSKEFSDEEIRINTLCFNGYPLHNGYELDRIFNVTLNKASLMDLASVAWPWGHYRLWQIGKKCLPNRKTMAWDKDYSSSFNISDVKQKSYFDGYWQSPRFFDNHRKAIINALKFPTIVDDSNIKAIQFIRNKPTAFIHVRRGDYLNHPTFGGICTDDYYKNAIALLRNELGYSRFLIFSNEILWCRENLKELLTNCDVMFADWNTGQNSYRDMQLMSECRAGIIANSSFSWWGAWLADSEIIICPEKWTNIPGHHDDIISSSWRRISLT